MTLPLDQQVQTPAMSLGEHLEELRWRIVKVLLILIGLFFVQFLFFVDVLHWLLLWPLDQAVSMVSVDTLHKLELRTGDSGHLLRSDSMIEAPILSIKMCALASVFLAVPILVYELWRFVSPGLHKEERKIGFLFIPAAVIFFYSGIFVGYVYGLPFLYMALIEFNALYSSFRLDFKLSDYFGMFTMLTLCFGFIMDIPWLILVLIRVRLVSPEQLSQYRGYVMLAAALLSALISPPDPLSMVALLLPMLLLYEVGIIAGRMLYGKNAQVVGDQSA